MALATVEYDSLEGIEKALCAIDLALGQSWAGVSYSKTKKLLVERGHIARELAKVKREQARRALIQAQGAAKTSIFLLTEGEPYDPIRYQDLEWDHASTPEEEEYMSSFSDYDQQQNEPVDIGQAAGVRETEKALLVKLDGKEVWIPKSVIHNDSEVFTDLGLGRLVVKRWWATKNGYA